MNYHQAVYSETNQTPKAHHTSRLGIIRAVDQRLARLEHLAREGLAALFLVNTGTSKSPCCDGILNARSVCAVSADVELAVPNNMSLRNIPDEEWCFICKRWSHCFKIFH